MSNNFLTGTENIRFEDIHDRWLVFEPISNENYALKNNLFTVDPGQKKKPEMFIFSGSVPISASVINIKKDIHFFYDHTEAIEFINNIGSDNVSYYEETEITENNGAKKKITEVHVIDYPELSFEFDILNFNEKSGFVANVYLSASSQDSFGNKNDLIPVYKKVIYDKSDKIVSDTYLKYFKLEGNK